MERLIKVVSPSSLLQSLASSKSNEENIQSNIPKRSVAGVKKKLLDKRSRLTNASMRGKDPDIHEEKKTVPVPASGAVDLKCASFQSQGSVKERIGQKLKLGLNVPASRMKGLGHNAGAPSEETESGRAKVNGPTKPASELPENLGSSTWDILEMEDCVDCVDQQTNRGISESEIRRLNAEYEY